MAERVWTRWHIISAISIIVIAIAVLSYLLANRFNTTASSVSPPTLLAALWQNYKQTDWQDGRTINHQANNVTTSEGQSYTMLRAVWSNDPKTFADTWQWTVQHLQQPDMLFDWRWYNSGSPQVAGNTTTASDADTDIALALVMAGDHWHNPAYLAAAKTIIPAIWEQEVVTIQNKPYLTADDLEKKSAQPVLNPSYWAPYAYRIFAKLDPTNPWDQLATQTYTTLQATSQQQLNTSSSANLPPDWASINRQTGQLQADTSSGHDSNFGYDAFRTVWRVAVDYQWNHDATAKSTLASFSSLTDFWNHDHKLYAIYTHSGKPAVNYESPAMYGGTLGYFAIVHPATAHDIYAAKIQLLYNSRTHQFASTVGYYENNWLWFGLALYTDHLSNLTSSGGTS